MCICVFRGDRYVLYCHASLHRLGVSECALTCQEQQRATTKVAQVLFKNSQITTGIGETHSRIYPKGEISF